MIYLDNAATSHPKPECVYQRVDTVLRHYSANPGRAGHAMAAEADRIVFEARESIARFFSIADAERIIFTPNTTGALNLALFGLLQPGDHCITTSMEHNSVVRPLHRLSQSGVSVEKVWASKEGVLDPLKIRAAITSHTKLIAMTHASNVIGTITPLAEVVEIAHARGIPVLLDAAQTAGTLPIAVHDLGLDLLACPGHKGLYGPQGTGFLYVAPRIDLRPLLYGGTGSRSDVPEMPDFLPDRFEAGTVNTPGIAGLGAGIEFLISTGIDNVRAHEVALNQCLLEGLKAIEGAEVFGVYDAEKRASVILFNILGIDCGAIGDQLDTEFEIACRVGIHCAPDAHRTLGIFPRGGIRLSPGFFNTPDDIDCALDAIRTIAHHKPELWTPPKSSSSKALTSL